jgi:hypothetical protein
MSIANRFVASVFACLVFHSACCSVLVDLWHESVTEAGLKKKSANTEAVLGEVETMLKRRKVTSGREVGEDEVLATRRQVAAREGKALERRFRGAREQSAKQEEEALSSSSAKKKGTSSTKKKSAKKQKEVQEAAQHVAALRDGAALKSSVSAANQLQEEFAVQLEKAQNFQRHFKTNKQ